MTEIYGAQLILINLPPFDTEVLKFICQRSNSLYNQAVYFVRRNQELTHPGLLPNVPYSLLCSELKDQWNYWMLCAQAAQQTLKSVQEAIEELQGFDVSLVDWWLGNKAESSEIQGAWWIISRYLSSGGLYLLS